MKKITVTDILKMKEDCRKIPVLTSYGYSMAIIVDTAGIPIIMVGDSVGMVEAGFQDTLSVTLEDIIYHTKAVVKGRTRALVVADMPFMSYHVSIEDTKRNAGRLVKEGGAEAVKMEGGVKVAETIKAVVEIDIPVMGHIGLTPQSIHAMGGYKIQGRERSDAERLMKDAEAVEVAGAFAVVIEGVPSKVAKEITASLSIPSIGIGAGPHCDGQVLVAHDMLGLFNDIKPKYVKRYADLQAVISSAVKGYIKDVEEGTFPDEEHSFK